MALGYQFLRRWRLTLKFFQLKEALSTKYKSYFTKNHRRKKMAKTAVEGEGVLVV